MPLIATTILTAVGVALLTWPLPRVMGSATLQAGDTLLAAWQLNAFHHSLLTDLRAWADANIFFPSIAPRPCPSSASIMHAKGSSPA